MHKINLVPIAMLCAVCAAMLSCNLDFWKESSPVIAEVDNSRLRVSDLREIMNENDSISKEEWVRHIDTWVNFEIMYREAMKRGLHKDPETQKIIKIAEKKILVDRLKLTMDSVIDMESDKELQEFYDRNKEMFRKDSVSYIPFKKALNLVRRALLSEKRINREKKWLTETKNLYSIEVYPQYLDSLR